MQLGISNVKKDEADFKTDFKADFNAGFVIVGIRIALDQTKERACSFTGGERAGALR